MGTTNKTELVTSKRVEINMGSTCSKNTNTSMVVDGGNNDDKKNLFEQRVRRNNDTIEQNMIAKRQEEETKVKYLLLGAGESGKSTIFKQMRILYGSPMSDDTLRVYGVVIRSNIKTVVMKLCQLIRMLEVEEDLDTGYESSEVTTTCNKNLVEEEDDDDSSIPPSKAFKVLTLHFAIHKSRPRQL